MAVSAFFLKLHTMVSSRKPEPVLYQDETELLFLLRQMDFFVLSEEVGLPMESPVCDLSFTL